MDKEVMLAVNRLIETVDRMKVGLTIAKQDVDAGNPLIAMEMQWLFDSDMAQLEKRYRSLIKLLE